MRLILEKGPLLLPPSVSSDSALPATMNAVLKPHAASGFEFQTSAPVPSVGPQDVLIRVTHTGICGTDLHITEWDAWSASRIKPPLVYGHEFCGSVASIGSSVTRVAVGDFVTAEMHLPCGDCPACRDEKPHICQTVEIAGVDRNGSYADYIALPEAQIIRLPEGISRETAACLDAVGNAVHVASKVPIKDKTVLITGCGPIGLFAVAAARALGAKAIYASDVQAFRLDLAKRVKADVVYNAADVNVLEAVLAETQGDGVDVVLEMSGHPAAIETGLDALKPGGAMVLLGIPPKPITLDFPKHILFKETRILGVTGREMFRTWEIMLELLVSGRLDVSPLITHRFPAEKFGDAIALMQTGESGKVILNWE
jgi:threonine 3-dehydrogenase